MKIMKSLLQWMVWALVLVSVQAVAQTGGTVTYVYTDPQGTPLAEADTSGNITATFEYTPYGTYAPSGTSSPGPDPNGPGYTGHVNDPETDLVYMQARYYDPATGRFLSTDPVGPSGDDSFNFNRYDYASNNPILNTDPNGRATQPWYQRAWSAIQRALNSPAAHEAEARMGAGALAGSEGEEGGTTTEIAADQSLNDQIEIIASKSQVSSNSQSSSAAASTPTTTPTSDLHAPGDAPDSQVIVRGGASDMPKPGQTFSGSQGSTVEEAASGVPHGQIRTSTAGSIRANGGTVEVAPEPTRSGQINGQHVNVTEGGNSSTFSNPPQTNPVQKSDRVQ
jgi:RHS repeat-associated protein